MNALDPPRSRDAVPRTVVDWSEDEHGTIIARLDCGHQQPVHPRQPNDPGDPEPRDHPERLACERCFRLEPPVDVAPYRSTPVFDNASLPAPLQRHHTTKRGVWGNIEILEGALRYVVPSLGHDQHLTPDTPGWVPPELEHFVELVEPVRVRITFLAPPPRDPHP